MNHTLRAPALAAALMALSVVACQGKTDGSGSSSSTLAASAQGSSTGGSQTTVTSSRGTLATGSTAVGTGSLGTSTSGSGSAVATSIGGSTSASGSGTSTGSTGGQEVLDGLVVTVALTLSSDMVEQGQTLTGTATLFNPTNAAISLLAADIAARPPGGTNPGGPYLDLYDGPAVTVDPGATFVLTGGRVFTTTDPLGGWYAYVTLEDSAGTYHDSALDVTFAVVAAGGSSTSSSTTGTGATSSAASSSTSSARSSGASSSTGKSGSTGNGSSSGARSSSSSTGGSSGAATTGSSGGNFYNLGINAPGLNYYNNAPLYADMTLQMAGNDGRWDVATGTDAAAPLDATGSPTVAAWAGVTGAYPSGVYTVTWDGTGSLTVNGQTLGTAAVTSSNGVQHNTASLTWTQQLSTPTGASWFQFKATPPITNLHIQAPSSLASAGSPFLNEFLTHMKPFKNIRFMDALNTNGNLVQNWSQRTWPNAGSRAGTAQGMAYEDIIALANQAHVDVWINVPALATDDYVCRLARLFRYGEQGDTSDSACDPAAPAGTATVTPLNASSKLYVEYSNEIWNWGFQQIEDVYCMVWGQPDKTGDGKHCDVTAPTSTIGAAALADTSLPWDASNTYGKASQFVMILEKRQSDMFRTIFGCSSGAGCEVQIPMNVQAAYAAEADEGFKFLAAAYGSVGAIDLMAVAPYFGTESDSDNDSVDDIFTDLQTVLSSSPASNNGSATANWLKGDLAEAALYNLPIIAYEGGQGLSSSTYVTNTIAAQSDPRMYTATLTYFSLWDQLIGRAQLFNYYTYVAGDGSYGCWGALVNQDDPGSQKWDALMSLTRTPGDANLDGVVDSADCAILQAHFGQSGQWWMQGDFNHDGAVDAADLQIMNTYIQGSPCTSN